MAATPTAHIKHIDGVRAIAVGGVVLLHVWEFHGSLGNWYLDRAFAMGAHGVDLFFVVSGFCLAFPILRAVRARGEATFVPTLFYAKRIVRIVPPYYAILILLAIALPLAGMPTNGMHRPIGVIEQMLFLDRGVVFLNRSFWTLAIEFRWYLLFPLLTLLYVRSPRLFATLGFTLMLIYSLTRLDAIDFGTLPAFMLGIWAADCHIVEAPIRKAALPVFFLAAALAFVFEPGTERAYYGDEPLAFIAATAFVMASGTFAPLHRVLTWKPLVALGICSYSVYLVNDSVLAWAHLKAGLPPLSGLALALAASVLFWWIFERPTTSTSLRPKLVSTVQRALDFVFPRLGIPSRATIASPVAAQPAATPSAELESLLATTPPTPRT